MGRSCQWHARGLGEIAYSTHTNDFPVAGYRAPMLCLSHQILLNLPFLVMFWDSQGLTGQRRTPRQSCDGLGTCGERSLSSIDFRFVFCIPWVLINSSAKSASPWSAVVYPFTIHSIIILIIGTIIVLISVYSEYAFFGCNLEPCCHRLLLSR